MIMNQMKEHTVNSVLQKGVTNMKTFYAEFGGEFFAEELGTDEKVITQFTIDEGQFIDEELGIVDLSNLMSVTGLKVYRDIIEVMPQLKECVMVQTFSGLEVQDESISNKKHAVPIHLYDASGHQYF